MDTGPWLKRSASVRGFYVTYDHTYHYVGVQGISLPGDFNTRFLVMLNGHPLTDNIYDSNGFFGQDFGLDMDLVERIEIIRGPTSALYGSNGMLANINVVTRSPVDAERLRVSAETDTFGEGEGLRSIVSVDLRGGANLLLSGSLFDNAGVSFPSNGLAVPAGVGNSFSKADGEKGYHTFANLIWHNWSFTAYLELPGKATTGGAGDEPVGRSVAAHSGRPRPGQRGLQAPGGSRRTSWQVYYDRYRYQDRFDYPVAGRDRRRARLQSRRLDRFATDLRAAGRGRRSPDPWGCRVPGISAASSTTWWMTWNRTSPGGWNGP